MMRSSAVFLSGVLIHCFASTAVASPQQSETSIPKLIGQLDSADVSVRDSAQNSLIRLEDKAIPPLEKALAHAAGERRARISEILRRMYLGQASTQLAARWKDVYLASSQFVPGFLHFSVLEEREHYVVTLESQIRNERRGGLAIWTFRTVCKKDRFLTPVSATCKTTLEGHTWMDLNLQYAEGMVTITGTQYRDESESKPLDPPRKISEKHPVEGPVIIFSAGFPALSLAAEAGKNVPITLLVLPADIDEPFRALKTSIEFLGHEETEVNGETQKASKFRVPIFPEFFLTKSREFALSHFKRVTKEEALEVVRKK